MRGFKRVFLGIVLLQAIYLLGSAVATVVVFWVQGDVPRPIVPPALDAPGGGFAGGFCHGFLGLWAAWLNLWGSAQPVYQVANSGFAYNLGYLFGAGGIVAVLHLPETVASQITRKSASMSSVISRDGDEKEERQRGMGLYWAGVALVGALVCFLVVPAGSWLPLPPGEPLPSSGLGWFEGLAHGQVASLTFMVSWFDDGVTLFQAGGGSSYGIGFRLAEIVLVGISWLKCLAMLALRE